MRRFIGLTSHAWAHGSYIAQYSVWAFSRECSPSKNAGMTSQKLIKCRSEENSCFQMPNGCALLVPPEALIFSLQMPFQPLKSVTISDGKAFKGCYSQEDLTFLNYTTKQSSGVCITKPGQSCNTPTPPKVFTWHMVVMLPWLSGQVHKLRIRCQWFKTHQWHCFSPSYLQCRSGG